MTILAAIKLGEHPSRQQFPFIIASVAGVIFIMAMDNTSNVGANSLGTLALLGAITAVACYNVASRKASSAYQPLQITWVRNEESLPSR